MTIKDTTRRFAGSGRAIASAGRLGGPERAPVVFHINSRVWLLNPALNTRCWTFRDYYERPDVALETELQFQKWRRVQRRTRRLEVRAYPTPMG